MKSQLARNKTDAVDASFIRYYCELLSPPAWKPLPQEVQELQALVKRRDALNKMMLQEQNRLENAELIVEKSIDKIITYLQGEINSLADMIESHITNHSSLKEKSVLLNSIPGIGEKTIAKTLAFLSEIPLFDSAKKLATYIGLNPQHAQSGTSLNFSRISKTGNADLRKMLYMPALVAIQHEPNIKLFYERLIAAGKPKKVAICAVMRKLIHIIYGVLKSHKPFNSQLIALRCR